jgi:tetratricopeptide (TPR) repeat protein
MEKENEVIAVPRPARRRTLSASLQADFDAGRRDLEAGRFNEALKRLRIAHSGAPTHARIRSYLGVAMAYGERNFSEARALCEGAARQDFFHPEVYLNLARVYLRFDRRAEALRYLRRGLMIAPGHAGIVAQMAQLGRRQLPIVSFLPRRHPVNRVLGTARSRLAGVIQRGRARRGDAVDTASASL